jgi:hypothetical protein
MMSSARMWHYVIWLTGNNGSEESNASNFRAEKSPTLNTYAVSSSEQFVPTYRTRRYTPKYSELPIRWGDKNTNQKHNIF